MSEEKKPTTAQLPAATGATDAKASLPVRTEKEWREFMDDVVDRANLGLRRAGLEHEAVADLLFKAVFENDVESGLDPQAHATEAFRRLSVRAGASLQLQPAELVAYLRVGAMNQHRRDAAWRNMDWSKKLLLVPLLALEGGRALMTAGIAMAGKPNVGVRHLREWVQGKIPRKLGSRGRPRGSTFTVSTGTTFVQTGSGLKTQAQRRKVQREIEALPPEAREKFVRGLKDTLAGLQALLDELDDE